MIDIHMIIVHCVYLVRSCPLCVIIVQTSLVRWKRTRKETVEDSFVEEVRGRRVNPNFTQSEETSLGKGSMEWGVYGSCGNLIDVLHEYIWSPYATKPFYQLACCIH